MGFELLVGAWMSIALAGDSFVGETTVRSSSPPVTVGNVPPEIWEVAQAHRHEPLPARMDAISKALLGRPYTVDPLGEGQAPDPDPLVRYDTFDCLTYVEEVIALAMAGDVIDVARVRNGLRYGADPVSYFERHHFMEFQWIPEAIEGGWLRDATADYGAPIQLERSFSLEQWNNWAGRQTFHHLDEQLPTGTLRLQVLPLEQARKVAQTIRPGSIVLTVREDRSWKPLWISHLGLVFHSGDHAIHRHATKMGSGGTVDHDLDWYLEHIGTYSNWPALGIAILEPLEAGPRVSRLPTAETHEPSDPSPLPAAPGTPDPRDVHEIPDTP